MLAGPNGSGKSSLVPLLLQHVDLGVSVNADEIEADLKRQSGTVRLLNLHDWSIKLTGQDLLDFGKLDGSQRLPVDVLGSLRIENNVLVFQGTPIDSYLAAWVAELLRSSLLAARQTLTFETVMSHPSKLDFLRDAQAQGFRTYLYFVATNDPNINVARVGARVKAGGHAVSAAKITERYHRSLDLARQAIAVTDRAYLFDNSGAAPELIAEITNGRQVSLETDVVPAWVAQILS